MPPLLVLCLSLFWTVAFAHDGFISLMLTKADEGAWLISAHEPDEDLTDGSLENPGLELIPLLRYSFDLKDVDSRRHPLVLYGVDGEILLSQDRSEGLFEEDRYVAFEADQKSLSFNLTPDLAERLRGYRCATHPEAHGQIRLVGAALE